MIIRALRSTRLPWIGSVLCLVAFAGACADEEMPRFAPHGRDATVGPREGDGGSEQAPPRDGGVPVPVSGISTRTLENMLSHIDELGADYDDPDRLCAGLQHSCAIDGTNHAVCWGGNIQKQSVVPPDLPPLKSIACSLSTTCALDETGKIWCWGSVGEVPEGSFVRLTSFPEGAHACALKEDGEAVCWYNGGDTRIAGRASAYPAPDGDETWIFPPAGMLFSSISAGPFDTCGTELNSGTIVCWGGYSGYGATSPSDIPDGSFVEVAVGGYHKCARTEGGDVKCWGWGLKPGLNAEVCAGVTVEAGAAFECGQSLPPALPPDTTYKRIRLGSIHSCAIRSNYTAACWGWNLRNLSTPPPLEQFSQIVAGGSHTCAMRTNGGVLCWGETTNRRTSVPSNFAK